MKGILISVVDVLGIFVPGFLLFASILICPPLAIELNKQLVQFPNLADELGKNFALVLTVVAIISYVLGFLIRLYSIVLIHWLTRRYWAEKLGRQTRTLEEHIRVSLKDDELCESLKREAELYNKYTLNYQAPLFGFVKRIIKMGNTSLWAEAERLEAEIRFSTGIFIPLLLFAANGLWIWFAFGLVSGIFVFVAASLGVTIILLTFPGRRIKEVMYTYYLALILLRYGPVLLKSDRKTEAADEG